MSNWPDLRIRVEDADAEIMDDLSVGGAELAGALYELRWINRLLGSFWPTLEGVQRLWRQAGCPNRLTVLDVGAGSGDVNRALLRWADRRAIDLQITLIDIHPETCEAAADYYHDEPRVQVEQGDVLHLDAGRADIVTASLFVHHFPTAQLPEVFLSMRRAARIGVVVNDLHRHPVAWGFIRLATRLLSRNRMIRHDGPMSVRRGFQGHELAQLRQTPGLTHLWYAWRPLFRFLVIV